MTEEISRLYEKLQRRETAREKKYRGETDRMQRAKISEERRVTREVDTQVEKYLPLINARMTKYLTKVQKEVSTPYFWRAFKDYGDDESKDSIVVLHLLSRTDCWGRYRREFDIKIDPKGFSATFKPFWQGDGSGTDVWKYLKSEFTSYLANFDRLKRMDLDTKLPHSNWEKIEVQSNSIPKLLNLSGIFLLDGLVSEEFTQIPKENILGRLNEAIKNPHFDYILSNLEKRLRESL